MNQSKLISLSFSPRSFTVLVLGFLFLAMMLPSSGRSAQASGGVSQEATPQHTLEVRYADPAASAVLLVWGVNGWKATSIEGQPEGTLVKNGVMNTPMTPEDGVFVARLQLPAWAQLDYGFLSTREQNGAPVQVWQDDGGKDFQATMGEKDMVVEAEVNPAAAGSAGGEPAPMVNLDIRYHAPSAGEVYLVWGINGWALPPEAQRPVGTMVKENVLHTPMLLEEQAYVTRLQLPAGTTIDFGFLTTKDPQGNPVNVWEANGGEDYRLTLTADKALDIQSQEKPKTGRDLPSYLVVGLYVLMGIIVILIVGFVFGRKSG